MRELVYSVLVAAGTSLSLNGLYRAGQMLGSLMWLFLPGRAKETTCRVSEHLGLGPEQARKLARSSFQNTVMSFLEIFHTRHMDIRFLRNRIDYENPDLFQKLCETARPVVIATAHLGSWELLGGMPGECDPSDYQVVVRQPRDKALGKVIAHLRARPHVRTLPHRQAAQETLNHLRNLGKAVFLVDHNCTRAEAEFLPFLGLDAAVNKGPAILALRAKAEVWPFFLIRLPQGRFRAVTMPPLDTTKLAGSRSERIQQICAFYTQAVEDMVQHYPEQWFWMHRRWKTRP